MQTTTERFDYAVFCRASQMTLASDSANSLQEAFDICDAIANHHRPDEVDCSELSCAVHLGDALAHAMDLANDPQEAVPKISERCWRKADLAWRDSQEIFAEVEQEFAALSQALLN